jgi:hypothetical protein
MQFLTGLVALATVAHAHCLSPLASLSSLLTLADTFPSISYGGKNTAEWEYVRKTTNYQSNGPVTDVKSSAMTCYQLAPGSEGAKVMNVTAGSTLTYTAMTGITHPGALLAYMAKVPAGQSVTDFAGTGNVFFKIYEDHPTISSGGMSWPSQGEWPPAIL